MLSQSYVMDASSVAPSVLEYVALPYSPSLLLEVHFPLALVADHGFSEACEVGFNDYFGEMCQESTLDELVCVERVYTWADVEQRVVSDMVTASEKLGERLPWCAGYALGWLSALALTQRSLALRGVGFLYALVTQVQKGDVTC